MKINLTQSEIEQAIIANVTGTLILTPGTQVSVSLFSPRGGKEINAAVTLLPPGAVAEVEPVKTPVTRKRAAATETATAEAAGTTGDAAVAETAVTSTETAVESDAEEGNVVAETVEETGAGEVAEKPKSLFGNLGRPKNA